MPTLAEFIAKHGITMSVKSAATNPNMPDPTMTHWRCSLRNAAGKRMSVPFSMGAGHNGKEPTAEDVLDCLALDAAGVENANGFEDWCAEYGYDTDSRAALKTFKTCETQAEKLREFAGEDYDSLLFETERQ